MQIIKKRSGNLNIGFYRITRNKLETKVIKQRFRESEQRKRK